MLHALIVHSVWTNKNVHSLVDMRDACLSLQVIQRLEPVIIELEREKVRVLFLTVNVPLQAGSVC